MAEVGHSYLTILPSLKGFGPNLSRQANPQLAAAGQAGGKALGQGVAKGAKKETSGLGSAIGAAIGGGLALATVGFFKGAVSSASDLNETMSKSKAIFGDNAAGVEKWASTAAKSLGLSRQAALENVATFGDMFSQLGFAGDAAAGMSEQVVQMATDLASFNNLPTADVLASLSGAFRGEYDSLQRVIPNISAARVQQEALNETHKKSVNDLTAAEKATATLAIVQQDGARASGDFARTSGGLANQTKIAKAEFTDLQAEIGTKLLPVMVQGLAIGLKTADWISKNQTLTLALAGTIGGLVVAVKAVDAAQKLWNTSSTVANAVQKLVTKSSAGAAVAIEAEGTAAAATATKNEALAASGAKINASSLRAAGGIALVTAAAYEGGKALNAYFERNKAGAYVIDHLGSAEDSFTTALVNNKGKVDDSVKSLVEAQLAHSGLADKAAKAGITTDQLSAAVLGGATATNTLVEAWKAGGKPSNDTIFALLSLSAAYAEAGKNSAGLPKTITQAATATDTAAESTTVLATAADTAYNKMISEGDAAGLLTDAMDKLSGKTQTADEAHVSLLTGLDTLRHRFDDAKKSGDYYSTTLNTSAQSGRDNWKVLLDQIDAAKAHAAAVAAQTGSVQKGADAQRADEQAIRNAAAAAGFNAGEVNKMIAKYGAVPNVVSTDIQLHGLGGLQQVFDSLKQPRVLDVYVNAHTGGFNQADKHAKGGRLNLAKWSLVGENGPELIGPGGMVHTAAQTERMMAAVAQRSAPAGPMTIQGRLDIAGDGLTAHIEGMVVDGLGSLSNQFAYNA